MAAIWREEWVRPYESAWSIFEKFIYANVMERKELIRAFGNDNVKNIKGTHIGNRSRDLLTLNGFDTEIVQHYLKCNLHENTKDTIQKILNPLGPGEEKADIWFAQNLQWCNDCLSVGYHSLFHQFHLFKSCPFHGKTLLNACPACHTQIPFLISDYSMSNAFTCKCGNGLADLTSRWSKWTSELEISDASILRWISDNDISVKKDNWLYTPKYIDFQLINEEERTQQISTYSIRGSICGSESLDENFLQNISRDNRQIFKSVDKYIRNKLLYKHRPCIKRLQHLLKLDGEEFPPICPYAYAYVFWKQSLLDLPQFYGHVNGLQKSKGSYKPDFHVVAPIYKEELKQLFDKSMAVPQIRKEPTKGAIKWILNTASAFLYYRFFVNWLEVAEEGARIERIPSKERFRRIVNDGIRFAFQYSEGPNGRLDIQFIKKK